MPEVYPLGSFVRNFANMVAVFCADNKPSTGNCKGTLDTVPSQVKRIHHKQKPGKLLSNQCGIVTHSLSDLSSLILGSPVYTHGVVVYMTFPIESEHWEVNTDGCRTINF